MNFILWVFCTPVALINSPHLCMGLLTVCPCSFIGFFAGCIFFEIANILLGRSGGMPPTPTSNQQIEQLP